MDSRCRALQFDYTSLFPYTYSYKFFENFNSRKGARSLDTARRFHYLFFSFLFKSFYFLWWPRTYAEPQDGMDFLFTVFANVPLFFILCRQHKKDLLPDFIFLLIFINFPLIFMNIRNPRGFLKDFLILEKG